MKWNEVQDHALVSSFKCASTIDEALRQAAICLGFPLTKDAADSRLRRVIGTGAAKSLGGYEGESPQSWSVEAPDTLPGGFSCEDESPTIPSTPQPRVSLREAGDYQRILILPDTHVPYHDRLAWALMLRAAHVLDPDIIVHLGDLADFYAVSFHSKDPSRKHLLIDERDEVQRTLDTLAPFRAKKKITKGNHEFRLERYITEKAPELFGLVNTDEILGLNERGWEITPYGDSVKIGHIHFTHDEGTCGPLAHIKAGATFEGSAVIGHTHAMGKQYWRNALGVPHVSASFGWLGDFEEISYMHKAKAQRWQLGFGIGLLEPNGNMILHDCPIVDYSVEILGRKVT